VAAARHWLMRAAFTSGCREGLLAKKLGVGAVPTVPRGLLYAVTPPLPNPPEDVGDG
jgi:hypothetical protein